MCNFLLSVSQKIPFHFRLIGLETVLKSSHSFSIIFYIACTKTSSKLDQEKKNSFSLFCSLGEFNSWPKCAKIFPLINKRCCSVVLSIFWPFSCHYKANINFAFKRVQIAFNFYYQSIPSFGMLTLTWKQDSWQLSMVNTDLIFAELF